MKNTWIIHKLDYSGMEGRKIGTWKRIIENHSEKNEYQKMNKTRRRYYFFYLEMVRKKRKSQLIYDRQLYINIEFFRNKNTKTLKKNI